MLRLLLGLLLLVPLLILLVIEVDLISWRARGRHGPNQHGVADPLKLVGNRRRAEGREESDGHYLVIGYRVHRAELCGARVRHAIAHPVDGSRYLHAAAVGKDAVRGERRLVEGGVRLAAGLGRQRET